LFAFHGQLFADVLFQDNFNTQNGGVPVLVVTTLSGWSVTGNVDLVGNGFHDYYPGNGLYVDMEGSESNARIQTTASFAPGFYLLTFFLGNNWEVWRPECTTCGLDNTLTVTLGDFTRTYAATNAGQYVNVSFATTVAGPLTFEGGGPVDSTGGILDNVVLNAIPEPGSMALTGGALLGFVALLRRRRA
jgi:hypothetical protein